MPKLADKANIRHLVLDIVQACPLWTIQGRARDHLNAHYSIGQMYALLSIYTFHLNSPLPS